MKKIYEKTWFIWITLIFIAPLGIFLLYKYCPQYTSKKKKVIAVVCAVIFAMGIYGSQLQTTKTYEVDGVSYTIKGHFTTLDDESEEVIKELAIIGVSEINEMPSSWIGSELDFKVDEDREVTAIFEGKKLVKIFDKNDKKLVYYSKNKEDDIYDYSSNKLIKEGKTEEVEKEEAEKEETEKESEDEKSNPDELSLEDKEKIEDQDALGLNHVRDAGLSQENIDEIFNVMKLLDFKKIEFAVVESTTENDIMCSVTNADGIFVYRLVNGIVVEVVDEDLVYLYQNGTVNSYLYESDVDWTNLKSHTESAVLTTLKSPSTAQFPGSFFNPFDGWQLSREGIVIQLKSYVDSQNGFGAMIRSEFVINYRYTGDSYECIYFNFDGTVLVQK